MMDCGCIKFLFVELRISFGSYCTCTQHGIFCFFLWLLGTLGSIAVECTYLICVFGDSFDRTDPEMATIVYRAQANHSKPFVALCHGVDLLFCSSYSGDLLVIPKKKKPCRFG